MRKIISIFVVISFLLVGFQMFLVVGENEKETNPKTQPNEEMDSYPLNSRSIENRGLANSPWPMFGQNRCHTGRSPYNTSTNPGKLKWSFSTGWGVEASPIIGSDGTIYVGSYDKNFYAINPNGTMKWKILTGGKIEDSAPAIDSNGTIYIGTLFKLLAINPDGTEKWNFSTNDQMHSSPAIGVDGTIYVGSWNNKLYAINSDGTEKWNFTTGNDISTSPAISSNGTIYIGSRKKLYAIDPDGTGNWTFETSQEIGSSPAIGTDNTIYIGSLDYKLYAINPNGTEKWSYMTGQAIKSASPAIASDGTIYIGTTPDLDSAYFYAINPNGTKKWRFKTERGIRSSPSIGFEGTIYISGGDYLHAIYPNGTEKWNFTSGTGTRSTPTIGSDGTIYIGYGNNLYAIGTPSQNQPPIAKAGPDQNVYVNQTVNFNGSGSYDPDIDFLTYKWSFGDGNFTSWQSDCNLSHIYTKVGNYTITLNVSDGLLWDIDICLVNVLKGSPLANSPWPKFRGNLRNTGLSKYDTSKNAGKLLWKFETEGEITSSPIIGLNGTIYICSRDKFIYALGDDSTIKWYLNLNGFEISTTPVQNTDGTIYIGSHSYLYALNPEGLIKWELYLKSIESSPTIGLDGTIYIGTKGLAAINPNGTLKWKFITEGPQVDGPQVSTTPAFDSNGVLYFGSEDYLYSVYPNGTLNWKYNTKDGGIISSPAIDNYGTIYFGTGSSGTNIYALNPNGTLKWKFKTETMVSCSPAISSDGTIYIGPTYGDLYAFYPNGTRKWIFPMNFGYSSPSVGSDGTIFVGSEDNFIYAIKPNGTLKWKFNTEKRITSSPAISSNGTIYVGSNDWYLYAIGGNITEENQPPVANAGPDQNVTTNQTVYFDGSGSSDPDGQSLTYNWDFGDGNSIGWQNQSTTSHSYDKIGIYVVTLTVRDMTHPPLLTSIDTCIIRVFDFKENQPPIADAGPDQNITTNQSINFNGSGSYDPDGDNITFEWTSSIDGKLGSGKTIQNIKLSVGNHTITLKVSDGELIGIDICIVYVAAIKGNLPPIANAGPDQNITLGQIINLYGSGSYDPDGDIITFEWTSSVSGKLGIGIILKNIKLTSGIHTITLSVSDGELSDTDTCIVRVSNISKDPTSMVNLPPVAKIKPILITVEGEKVSLSAADSFDEDGHIIQYIWDFGDGSEELRTNKTEVEHIWTSAGNYTIKLTVIDNNSANDSYSLQITVIKSKTIDLKSDGQSSFNSTNAIILIVIVIIILMIIATSKLLLSRSKRQRDKIPHSDEEILSKLKHNILHGEPLSEMDYSKDEIEGLLERKLKAAQISEQTHKLIRAEILASSDTPTNSDQTIDPHIQGKE